MYKRSEQWETNSHACCKLCTAARVAGAPLLFSPGNETHEVGLNAGSTYACTREVCVHTCLQTCGLEGLGYPGVNEGMIDHMRPFTPLR